MVALSRREFLYLSLAASAGLAPQADTKKADVHQQLLDLAARQEEQRRARFAAVKSKDDLQALQKTLRETFLRRVLRLLRAFACARPTSAIKRRCSQRCTQHWPMKTWTPTTRRTRPSRRGWRSRRTSTCFPRRRLEAG